MSFKAGGGGADRKSEFCPIPPWGGIVNVARSSGASNDSYASLSNARSSDRAGPNLVPHLPRRQHANLGMGSRAAHHALRDRV